MPRYRAKKEGYHDDCFRSPEINGGQFDSPIVYETLPSWLEIVRDDLKKDLPVKPVEERKRIIIGAMHSIMRDDPEKQNPAFWIGDGSPEIKELRKRTQLKDITAKERNIIWQSIQLHPSGKTKLEK